jgi:hypothetical protein
MHGANYGTTQKTKQFSLQQLRSRVGRDATPVSQFDMGHFRPAFYFLLLFLHWRRRIFETLLRLPLRTVGIAVVGVPLRQPRLLGRQVEQPPRGALQEGEVPHQAQAPAVHQLPVPAGRQPPRQLVGQPQQQVAEQAGVLDEKGERLAGGLVRRQVRAQLVAARL